MKYSFWLAGLFFFYGVTKAEAQHAICINDNRALKDFFAYTGNDVPLVSGHRGAAINGYAENSVGTFEYVLQHIPAFFEIDPRLTKDSVIVLMHDATLDRTTTGKGKLSDYTWQELQQFNLRDAEGHPTTARIPRLADVIEWARGKTILNLDKKDVPPQMIVQLIHNLKASHFVIVTVHNADQAAFYYKSNPDLVMSAFVKTPAELETYEKAGIPWQNMIAYIGSQNIPENKKMLYLLHARKVMCMISAAPVYDKLRHVDERARAYHSIFAGGADILESDLPVEVARVVKTPPDSPKRNFFCARVGHDTQKNGQ